MILEMGFEIKQEPSKTALKNRRDLGRNCRAKGEKHQQGAELANKG